MATPRDERIEWLRDRRAVYQGQVLEAVADQVSAYALALDEFIPVERAWLASILDRQRQQRASDARQALGAKRSGLTQALNAALAEMETKLDADFQAATDPAFTVPQAVAA